MRDPIEKGRLTTFVSGWCKRVEFPITINDLGEQTVIHSERPDQFTYRQPYVTKEGNEFTVRAFPINRSGIEGEIYVFVSVEGGEEFWDKWGYAQYSYPKEHPQAVAPAFPPDLVCLHGINLKTDIEKDYQRLQGPMGARLDYRGNRHNPTISRESRYDRQWLADPEVMSYIEEILLEHLRKSKLANSEEGWKYKQRLVDDFALPFWGSLQQMIPVYKDGELQLVSLEEIKLLPKIKVLSNVYDLTPRFSPPEKLSGENLVKYIEPQNIYLLSDAVMFLSAKHRHAIFQGRLITDLKWLSRESVLFDWSIFPNEDLLFAGRQDDDIRLAQGLDSNIIGVRTINLARGFYSSRIHLNLNHQFVRWLQNVKTACESHQHGFNEGQFERLMSLLAMSLPYQESDTSDLNNYLKGWMEIPDLPEELYPPLTELKPEMFALKNPNESEGL